MPKNILVKPKYRQLIIHWNILFGIFLVLSACGDLVKKSETGACDSAIDARNYERTTDKFKQSYIDVKSAQYKRNLSTAPYVSAIAKYLEIRPTIITGWNSDKFDIPYLYNRAQQIVGKNG